MVDTKTNRNQQIQIQFNLLLSNYSIQFGVTCVEYTQMKLQNFKVSEKNVLAPEPITRLDIGSQYRNLDSVAD